MGAIKQSAQGTIVVIGVASTAKNLSAATKANPGVFTSAAHGFTNGMVVKLAAIAGMTEANGKVGVVINATANTFSIAGLDTTNFSTYTSGGTATPTAALVQGIKGYNGFDGQKSEIDTTDFDSTAKEFIPGLEDFGQVSFDLFGDDTNEGQMALESNKAATNLTSVFVITLPNGKTRTFSGFVKQFGEQGQVDNAVSGTCVVRISGRVVKG